MLNYEIETAFKELINQIENAFTNKKNRITTKKHPTNLLNQTKHKNR
jgi:hypothetical protein